MDDAELFGWYGPWSPIGVRDVTMLLSGLDARWWIVGGHAIERFTGVSRHHDDIDVATTWPLLDTSARGWLQTTLTTMYPDHP